MKKNVFRLPKQLYFLRIEDWQVAFCEGDKCAAAILDFFANRHSFYLERLEEVEQRNKALNLNETVDPFMVQTISKIGDYTLGMFGRNKIIDAIQYLVENGVVSEKRDLQNNKSYCLNTEPVQVFIDNTWIPFLETLGKNDNPLRSYLSKIGFNQLKRQRPSLISNDENGGLKSNGGSLISNDETAIGSLISNDPSLISNDNKVRNSKNDSLVRNSTEKEPNGCVFSESDIEDFEQQLAAKPSKAQKPPRSAAPPNFEDDITEVLETLNLLANRCYTVTGERAKSNRECVLKLLKKNYTKDEIGAVIQTKCFEWLNNPEMVQYLRPSTLFGNKFQTYLEQYTNLKSNPHLAEQFKKKINATKPSNTAFDNAKQIADSVARLRAEGY